MLKSNISPPERCGYFVPMDLVAVWDLRFHTLYRSAAFFQRSLRPSNPRSTFRWTLDMILLGGDGYLRFIPEIGGSNLEC